MVTQCIYDARVQIVNVKLIMRDNRRGDADSTSRLVVQCERRHKCVSHDETFYICS